MRTTRAHLSIDQYAAALKARWRLGLFTMLSIVLAVVIVTLAMPARYTATASVLVDMKSADLIGGAHIEGQMLSAHMANEANVIQSERVMLQALKNLGLLDEPQYRARWMAETAGVGDFAPWLASRMGADLEIRPAREGSVMNVQYSSTQRTLAADMANAVVAAYIQTSQTLRVEPAQKFTEFYDERAKSSRGAVEAAQRRFSAYQQSKGILVTDERLDVESARLAELSTQMTALQAVASESNNRQLQAERQADVSPEVQGSLLLGQLNATLAQQETRLVELESRLSDQHPQIIEIKSGISQTRAKIKAESQRVVRGLGVPSDVNRSRLGEVSAALAAQRAKLLRLKSERDEAAVLQRDVENAQRAYDAAFSQVSQSELGSQSRQTNVSMLKTASTPTSASSPKTFVNIAVSLVLGSLLGLAAVYLRELTDRKLRSAEDVLEILGQPMLGTLPKGQREAASSSSHLRALLSLPARQLQMAPK